MLELSLTNAAILILGTLIISSIMTTISFYFYIQRVVKKR